MYFRFPGFFPGKKKASTTTAPNSISVQQPSQAMKRAGSDENQGGSIHGDKTDGGVHTGGPISKLDCDPPYRWEFICFNYQSSSLSVHIVF